MVNYDMGGGLRYDSIEYQNKINLDGGLGSGNWGHKGRPGQKGGSAPGGGIKYNPNLVYEQFPADPPHWQDYLEVKYPSGRNAGIGQRREDIQNILGCSEGRAKRIEDAFTGDSKASYRASEPEVLDSWFRGGNRKLRHPETPKDAERAMLIDQYIMESPKYGGEIYRGLKTDAGQLKVGGTIRESGVLSSWSSNEDKGRFFAEQNEGSGDMVVIRTSKHPYAAPVGHLAYWDEECEVLVSNTHSNPKGLSEYRIIKKTEHDGVTYVDVELVEG